MARSGWGMTLGIRPMATWCFDDRSGTHMAISLSSAGIGFLRGIFIVRLPSGLLFLENGRKRAMICR